MAKQLLGKKKHKICEQIANKKFLACFTRGGWEHGTTECWINKNDMDLVNYITKTHIEYVRNGKLNDKEDIW